MTNRTHDAFATRSTFLVFAAITVGSMIWLTAWGCGRASVAEEGATVEGDVTAADAENEEKSSFFGRLIGDEPEPVEVQVPTGTLVRMTLDNTLSSRESRVGETFTARVDQEVSVAGRVAIPQGAVVTGRVTEAHQADKIGGRPALGVEFVSLEASDGTTVPISASLRRVGKSDAVKDGAIIAGSTAAGAILGESIDKGEGGVVGGILGGIGGAFAAKETGGKSIEIPSGTGLAIELAAPMSVVVPG